MGTLTLRPNPPSGPCVLVIDDDAMLRRALVRGLKRRFVVSERDDAEVALAEIANGQRYDAIICDLTLGGMSGRQFLLALKHIVPEQADRAIILTGVARSAIDGDLLAVIGTRLVEKPATFSEIEIVIDEVLGGHRCAA